MRIVSLLPSTTEIVFAVGAGDELVGVTFECDFPVEARSRRIVSTSTLTAGMTPGQIDEQVRIRLAAGEDVYRLDEGALHDLDPELVITQDLCAVCAVDVANVDAALAHLGCTGRVLTIDPGRLSEVFDSIVTIGGATGRQDSAEQLVAALRERLERVSAAVAGRFRPRVAVLEWTDPPFTAGHWIPDMITAGGGDPVFGVAGGRSASTTWDALANARADQLIVAPCGFSLAGAAALATDLVDDGVLPAGVPVWAVDADAAFVRPGPRLVDGVETLAGICHPDRLPLRPDLSQLIQNGDLARSPLGI